MPHSSTWSDAAAAATGGRRSRLRLLLSNTKLTGEATTRSVVSCRCCSGAAIKKTHVSLSMWLKRCYYPICSDIPSVSWETSARPLSRSPKANKSKVTGGNNLTPPVTSSTADAPSAARSVSNHHSPLTPSLSHLILRLARTRVSLTPPLPLARPLTFSIIRSCFLFLLRFYFSPSRSLWSPPPQTGSWDPDAAAWGRDNNNNKSVVVVVVVVVVCPSANFQPTRLHLLMGKLGARLKTGLG